MRAARLQELGEMLAMLLETARELPPGQDRHNALQEIARFRARIIGLKRQDLRSAHRKLKAKVDDWRAACSSDCGPFTVNLHSEQALADSVFDARERAL